MDILILIGLSILGFSTGTYQFLKLRKFLSTGIKIKAQRIAQTTVIDNDNAKISIPIIEFIDNNGRIVKTKLDTNLYSKKSEIDIIYDPQNPQVIIVGYWTKHIPWIFLIIFGMIPFIGLIIRLTSR